MHRRAVAHQQVARREPAQRSRGHEPDHRMHADRPRADRERRCRAHGLGHDEHGLGRPPQRRLPPRRPADDRHELERRRRQCVGIHDVLHAEPGSDRGAVAVVAVEQPQDAGGLAEHGHRRHRRRLVDRVHEPNTAVDRQCVARSRHRLTHHPGQSVALMVQDSGRHARGGAYVRAEGHAARRRRLGRAGAGRKFRSATGLPSRRRLELTAMGASTAVTARHRLSYPAGGASNLRQGRPLDCRGSL